MQRDIDQYLPIWRKRLEEESRAGEERRREAMDAVHRMARILHREFRAEKVWLIGSLLRPESFAAHSDIDLVVAGLDPARYLAALARLWDELPKGMELDLIPLEEAADSLRDLVLSEGLTVHDQSRTADP